MYFVWELIKYKSKNHLEAEKFGVIPKDLTNYHIDICSTTTCTSAPKASSALILPSAA